MSELPKEVNDEVIDEPGIQATTEEATESGLAILKEKQLLWSKKNQDPKRIPVTLLLLENSLGSILKSIRGQNKNVGILRWFDSTYMILELNNHSKSCIEWQKQSTVTLMDYK
jgi:hypothetical protein